MGTRSLVPYYSRMGTQNLLNALMGRRSMRLRLDAQNVLLDSFS